EVDGLDRKEVERWLAEGGQPIATAPPAPKTLGDLAKTVPIEMGGERGQLGHGAVVIAAITSCTNTSNPPVMLAAGLLARDSVAPGLQDGRELGCTADHAILRADGQWVRADQLVPGEDRVVVGLESPTDEPGADEAGYALCAGGMTFTMSGPHERLRTLAFA